MKPARQPPSFTELEALVESGLRAMRPGDSYGTVFTTTLRNRDPRLAGFVHQEVGDLSAVDDESDWRVSIAYEIVDEEHQAAQRLREDW